MNVLALHHGMKKRSVQLDIEDDRLVDAAAGQRAESDEPDLAEFRPHLLKPLSTRRGPVEELCDDQCRFDVRTAHYTGYIFLYDLVEDVSHDLLLKACYSRVVELEHKKPKKEPAV
jgi:hypothetical protein